MKLEQFEDLLATLELSQLQTCYKDKYGDFTTYEPYSYRQTDKFEKFDTLCVEWRTGGYEGGNCWDSTEPTYRSSGNPPEELTDLGKVLEAVKHDMTFLQYRALSNQLIQSGNRTENEYYGNSTSYAYKYIPIKDLYEYLNDKGWLD